MQSLHWASVPLKAARQSVEVNSNRLHTGCTPYGSMGTASQASLLCSDGQQPVVRCIGRGYRNGKKPGKLRPADATRQPRQYLPALPGQTSPELCQRCGESADVTASRSPLRTTKRVCCLTSRPTGTKAGIPLCLQQVGAIREAVAQSRPIGGGTLCKLCQHARRRSRKRGGTLQTTEAEPFGQDAEPLGC